MLPAAQDREASANTAARVAAQLAAAVPAVRVGIADGAAGLRLCFAALGCDELRTAAALIGATVRSVLAADPVPPY